MNLPVGAGADAGCGWSGLLGSLLGRPHHGSPGGWRTPLVLREAFYGIRRFAAFQESLGIARNTLLNYTRGERRRWALADRIRGHDARNLVAPAADDGADVRDAIDRLNPDLSELVRLVHWEQMTLPQAAALLGLPDSTARARYARAKEQLRATLGAPAR